MHRIVERSRQPVDGASVAVFRIALGILLMVDAARKGELFFLPTRAMPSISHIRDSNGYPRPVLGPAR